MTNSNSPGGSTGTQATTTNPKEDEFGSFSIATDKVLINPNTKAGKTLFDKLAKSDIKPEDRLKGKSSEGETFRKLLKSLQAKGNFDGILTFIDSNGKKHDLANAPENTTIDEMIDYADKSIWNFDGVAATTGQIIKLSDKPKASDGDKEKLRAAIDIRAKNQIVRTFISQILDPDFYSTLVTKSTNQGRLVRVDMDNNSDKVIDGNILLLLIATQICPSTLSMVANIKAKAKSLKLADYEHDVSSVIGKYEDFIERILSHNGKRWDEEITVLFDVLRTCEDDQFITAIKSKEIEYLAGNFTDIHHLTSFAIAIYTNLKAKEIWMQPDKKSVQIAALMTQVETLKKNIAGGGSGAAYTTDSTGGQPGNSFKRPELAEWRYTHTGHDHVNKDGKDWYWCDHESHKRDPKCTSGLYCTTHGKGHPDHDHASWITYKKSNSFGKRKTTSSDSGSSATKTDASKISLNEKLKSALLTRTACTAADIEALSNQGF